MYTVFTDFHHASLLNSLILLFEKRLAGSVYRPIGRDWYDRGFWKIYEHPATVEQFLGIGGNTPDGTEPVNNVKQVNNRPGMPAVYFCHDIDSDKTNKAITLDGFLQMPIDIVIASIPQHIEPFKKLCQIHSNRPKLVYQIGNAWNVPDGLIVKNVMASAIVPNIPAGVNFISYHQEFNLNIFWPAIDVPGKNIYSFVNCFSIDQFFKDDWDLFCHVEVNMFDWLFKSFGGQCRDGAAHGSREIAKKMRESRFIWHTKRGGDGYGHVLHNAAAVGRPMIVKKQYYAGKMGEALMQDGETVIAIDNLNINEIINKIKYYNESTHYVQMCKNIYNKFKQVVDFDKEFLLLQYFFENLL